MIHICRQRYIERKRQTGIGLVEILIAVLIMSLGFLATAQMQIQSMRNSRSSYYQSQAYFLANDIIDRMRTNIDGVATGFYDNVQTTAAATNPGCSTKVCSDNELAQQDLYEWSANLHDLNGASNFVSTLPSTEKIPANGTITTLANGIYAVKMTWSDIINGSDQKQSLTLNFVAEVPN
jgi:type IV pilus assembly protein PilV